MLNLRSRDIPKREISKKMTLTDAQTATEMQSSMSFNLDSLFSNISNFEGSKSQDIEYFIESFEQMAAVTKIPDNLKILLLKTKLSGYAKQVLMHSKNLREEQNFEDFKKKLIESFKTQKSFAEAQHSFTNLKQKASQSVQEFAKQFNLEASKFLSLSGHSNKIGAAELLNTIKLSKFIQAIRSDVAFELEKLGPSNFDEALNQAIKIEMALNNKRHETNNINSKQNDQSVQNLFDLASQQQSEIVQLKNQLERMKLEKEGNLQAKLSNNIAKQTYKNSKSRYCHICKVSSHDTDYCYFNQKRSKNNSYATQNQNQPEFYTPRFNHKRYQKSGPGAQNTMKYGESSYNQIDQGAGNRTNTHQNDVTQQRADNSSYMNFQGWGFAPTQRPVHPPTGEQMYVRDRAPMPRIEPPQQGTPYAVTFEENREPRSENTNYHNFLN